MKKNKIPNFLYLALTQGMNSSGCGGNVISVDLPYVALFLLLVASLFRGLVLDPQFHLATLASSGMSITQTVP